MAWSNPKGFNFRATSGYVTDGANETYVLGSATAYPTTRTVNGESVTFGWETAPTGTAKDRSTAAQYAPELSGVNQEPGLAGPPVFRVDLPTAGTYSINVGAGDASFANYANFQVVDNATTLITGGPTSISAGTFMDATGVVRTSGTDWHANNAASSQTFASTICRLQMPYTATGAQSSVIAYFALTPAGGGSGISGSVSASFAPMLLSAAAKVRIAASLAKSFKPMTGSGTGKLEIKANATPAFRAMTLAADGTGATTRAASVAASFRPMTSAAAGKLALKAVMNASFRPMRLTSNQSTNPTTAQVSLLDKLLFPTL